MKAWGGSVLGCLEGLIEMRGRQQAKREIRRSLHTARTSYFDKTGYIHKTWLQIKHRKLGTHATERE